MQPFEPHQPRERKSFGQLFPQLFLFPLLLVVVGVLVWLFFIASAQDGRSVSELVADIESGGAHARRQDAYTLALKAREVSSSAGGMGRFSTEETRKLLRLLERVKGENDLEQFVTLALGRAGDPDLTLDLMSRLALADDTPAATRVHAVQALALSRSPRALDTLYQVLDQRLEPESWEIRWIALAGAANIRHESGIPYLRRALAEPRREMRWSAACWLAIFFGEPSGKDILWKLADWQYLDQERGDQRQELHPTQKELYMGMALQGLHRIDKEKSMDLLREKARDGRSVKVRDVAQALLEGKEPPDGGVRMPVPGDL
jgi:hypothetical protein